MNVAFVAYDGMTALDFVGAFDPVTRLETMGYLDLEWDVCAPTEDVTATGSLTVDVDAVDESLGGYDLLVVPGGTETRELVDDASFVDWLATGRRADLVASVCTGSLLLGAAGLLDGRRATTHPSAYDQLEAYCEVLPARVVDEGDLVTARGVSSALDLGLRLAERLADEETREEIAEQMDYPHYDPAAVVAR
jgi:cyclohexyl-isocyanide hydratase